MKTIKISNFQNEKMERAGCWAVENEWKLQTYVHDCVVR